MWSPTTRIEGAHSDRAASASTGDQSGLPLFSSSTTSVTIIHQSHHLNKSNYLLLLTISSDHHAKSSIHYIYGDVPLHSLIEDSPDAC